MKPSEPNKRYAFSVERQVAFHLEIRLKRCSHPVVMNRNEVNTTEKINHFYAKNSCGVIL